MAIDRKYGNLNIENIPDDEPVFVIRAKDISAPQALLEYANLAISAGSPETHTDAVREVASDMTTWQKENPDKVKVAD